MERTEEKVWIVAEKRPDGGSQFSVYDNYADANNFCIEMQALRGDIKAVRVEESVLVRRADTAGITVNDRPWGSLRVDVKSEFVEGLMEDMAHSEKIRPGAAEKFVNEKGAIVGKKAEDRIGEIVKKELEDELRVCMEDWCGYADMEY